MAEVKLTPWFPESVKPVRNGVYIASLFMDSSVYRHWNGRWWSMDARTPELAYLRRGKKRSSIRKIHWRGLSSPSVAQERQEGEM